MLSVEQYLKLKEVELICIKKQEFKKSYELLKSYGLCHKQFKKSDFLDELYKFCLDLDKNKILKDRYIQAYFLINEVEKERIKK